VVLRKQLLLKPEPELMPIERGLVTSISLTFSAKECLRRRTGCQEPCCPALMRKVYV